MTAAAAAAVVFPKWVLLEHYVFRRDDDKSFPDDTVAPIRASGTTSWGAHFSVAFSLADAPSSISRLYAHLPGFPPPDKEAPLQIVATHRHLALLDISTLRPVFDENLFIFKVDKKKSSLRALPPTGRYYDFRGDHLQLRSSSVPRHLDSMCSGLWCQDDDKEGQEFVVAELTVCLLTQGRRRIKAEADICLLRCSTDDDDDDFDQHHQWHTKRVPILPNTDDDRWKLSHWQTDAVVPFQQWLCWIDYHQGILFCDVSQKVLPPPTVSVLWFPDLDSTMKMKTKTPAAGRSRNGGVSVVSHGRLLKFVHVARHDGGPVYAPLKSGTGFTITCHTLIISSSSSSMHWKLDYTVTYQDLREQLPQGGIPMHPQVDIERPEIVHFLFVEFPRTYGKMSVLSIDMRRKTVLSCYLYFDGNQPNEAEDADFIVDKCLSPTPRPFLSWEFPRSFCCLSRKRKDMK